MIFDGVNSEIPGMRYALGKINLQVLSSAFGRDDVGGDQFLSCRYV
jgi:hypothetical protein